MALLPTSSNPAPVGMNASADPMLLSSDKAVRIQNFVAEYPGVLRGSVDLRALASSFSFPAAIDSVAWHYSSTPSGDRLLVLSGGQLYALTPTYPFDFPPTFTQSVLLGTGFTVGNRIVTATYGGETIIVQEGGLQPKRYDGTGLYQLGISPPSAAPSVGQGVPSASASAAKGGTVSYKYGYMDSLGRRSDLSPATSVTFAAGRCAFVQVAWPSDQQVVSAYIAATTNGGSVYYELGTIAKPLDVFEDNLPDSSVSALTQAPSIGQNAFPNPASWVGVGNGYVFLNDTTEPNTIQINSIGNPTIWSSVNYTNADGIRLTQEGATGDNFEVVIPFGSVIACLRRKSVVNLWNHLPDEFQFRPIHEFGIMAPLSAARAENSVLFLASDAKVYAIGYQEAFIATSISEEIETELAPLLRTAAGRETLEAACGWYSGGIYHLAIADVVYRFDMRSKSWTVFQQSAVTSYGNGITVQRSGLQPLMLTSCRGTPGVALLDTEMADVAISGMVYITRPFGEEPTRQRLKRPFKLTVYGEGTVSEGTITLLVDNEAVKSYSLLQSRTDRRVLGVQGFQPEFSGKDIRIKLELTGTNIEVREMQLEYEVLA